MTCNLVQTVLKHLRLPRNIKDANPDFEHDVVTLSMTVADLVKYMTKYEISYFYFRKDILKMNRSNNNDAPKRQRNSSAGSDVYACNLGRGTKAGPSIRMRNTLSPICGCHARFTVRFPNGYEHMPDNGINVHEHGEKKVTVTWSWKHNHDFNDQRVFAGTKLSRKAKTLLKIAVVDYGVTWIQIQREQERVLETCDKECPYEIMKINSSHVRYYEKRLSSNSSNSPFKQMPIVVSFGILIESIRSSSGFAEYTTDFRSTDTSQELKEFESSQKRPAWSLVIVSAWQKDVLKRNGNIIHLDSTHKTCYRLQTDEKVYLFTICVKNQVTGSGAPGAFMLSNSGKAPVIADFLRKVESFTKFAPKQAVIDCDTAETNALTAVWGSKFPITYCRFHVDEAFRQSVHNKIESSADKQEIEIEIQKDFDEVRKSKTKAEADQKIHWFLEKYKAHTSFIKYMKIWVDCRERIIEGYNPNYVREEDTNDIIESFHALLKSPLFLGKHCEQRPDALAHLLFTFVVPSFKGEEKKVLFGFSNRVCDEAETLAKLKAAELPDTEVQEKAFLTGEGEITVRSFTDNTKEYCVNLELAGSNTNTCTCPVNSNSGSICKHIHLAERFWEANTCPEGTSFETWNSESSALQDNSSVDLINEATRVTGVSLNERTPCSDQKNESFSDSFPPRVDREDLHTSISSDDQTASFIANSTAYIEQVEETPQDLLNTAFLDNESNQENEDPMNSNSLNRPQQECHGNLQAAAQRNELEKQRTIALAYNLIAASYRRTSKRFKQMTSAEQMYKYAISVDRSSRENERDSRNPKAKQRR